MIDTHCHLTFPDFSGPEGLGVGQTLRRAREAGITGMITIATTPGDGLHALDIARNHDEVWCTTGVHPLYSDEIDLDAGDEPWLPMRQAAADARCIAWGELGLDNHYSRPPREVQHAVLHEQLARIATWNRDVTSPDPDAGTRPGMPVILHCREAFDDLIPILRASTLDPTRCVFHCFTGTPDDARKVLDFGASISFTGVVTYRNAREVAQAARLVPDDRILVETDAPFLAPEPKRGTRPCEPAFCAITARFLAHLRDIDFDRFEQQVNDNTRALFGIDVPPRDPGEQRP